MPIVDDDEKFKQQMRKGIEALITKAERLSDVHPSMAIAMLFYAAASLAKHSGMKMPRYFQGAAIAFSDIHYNEEDE